jgi:hypothetical protein
MRSLVGMAGIAMVAGASVKNEGAPIEVRPDPIPKPGKRENRIRKSGVSKKGAWRKRKKQAPTVYADTRQQRRFEARMEHKRNTTKNMRRKTRVVQQRGAFS